MDSHIVIVICKHWEMGPLQILLAAADAWQTIL